MRDYYPASNIAPQAEFGAISEPHYTVFKGIVFVRYPWVFYDEFS